MRGGTKEVSKVSSVGGDVLYGDVQGAIALDPKLEPQSILQLLAHRIRIIEECSGVEVERKG